MYDRMRKYPDVSEKIIAVRTYGTVRAEPNRGLEDATAEGSGALVATLGYKAEKAANICTYRDFV